MNAFEHTAGGPQSILLLSRVALYPIDTHGTGMRPLVNATTRLFEGDGGGFFGLADQAQATGGKAFFNTNGFKEAVAEIVSTGACFYTISYTPTNTVWDDAFRHIKLSVDTGVVESGLDQFLAWLNDVSRLQYRRGYFATNPPPPPLMFAETPPTTEETRQSISYSPKSNPAPPNPTKPDPTKLDPVAARPRTTSFRAAMAFGMPTPTQLAFTVAVTPSSQIVRPQPGTALPKDNFLTESWRTSPFRIVTLHYTLNLADLEPTTAPSALPIGNLNAIPYALSNRTPGVIKDDLQFVSVLYRDDGALVNSVATTTHLDLDPAQASSLALPGVVLDQTIAIPAEGNFYLRAGVHETSSNRTSVVEIPTEDIHLPTPPARHAP